MENIDKTTCNCNDCHDELAEQLTSLGEQAKDDVCGKNNEEVPAPEKDDAISGMFAALSQRIDILEQMMNQFQKSAFATSCANVAVINLLKEKNVFTDKEIGDRFEQVLDESMGLKAKTAGDPIVLYDNLICEMWINDITNPENKTVDYRAYLNRLLRLTDDESFIEFKDMLSLIGQIYQPETTYKVIRKMPDDYPLNPSIAGKEIVYDVLIHAIKETIKKDGPTQNISNNTDIQPGV